MKEKTSVIGTLYKEALGFEGLDEVLIALGFEAQMVGYARTEAREAGTSFFQFAAPASIEYVSKNRVALMLRGILAEVVYDDQFEVGDTVALRSGGQVMTVNKVDAGDKTCDLIWNAIGMSTCMSCAFKVPFACLVPADPPA